MFSVCFDAVYTAGVTVLKGVWLAVLGLSKGSASPVWVYWLVSHMVVRVVYVLLAFFLCMSSCFDTVFIGGVMVWLSFLVIRLPKGFAVCQCPGLVVLYSVVAAWYSSDEFGNRRYWPYSHYKFECTRWLQPDAIVIVYSMTCGLACLGLKPTVQFSVLFFGVV